MNIKLVSFFIVIIGGFLMTSCSDDDSEKRVEFAKIVESRTSQDLLIVYTELYCQKTIF